VKNKKSEIQKTWNALVAQDVLLLPVSSLALRDAHECASREERKVLTGGRPVTPISWVRLSVMMGYHES
jgi:hypothetical protein